MKETNTVINNAPWRATKKRLDKLTFLNFMGGFAVPKVSSPEKLQDNIKINKK